MEWWIVSLSAFAFECFHSNITSRATFPNHIVLTSNVDVLHSNSVDVIVAPEKKVPVRVNRLRRDKRRVTNQKYLIFHQCSLFDIFSTNFQLLSSCTSDRDGLAVALLLCYPSLKLYRN